MSEFDPIKALGEEIAGVANILKTLSVQVQQAEMKAAEATQHYDDLAKLKAFAEGELARKRRILSQLQEEASKT